MQPAENVVHDRLGVGNLRVARPAARLKPDVAEFAYDDFKRADDLVRVGEAAMKNALPEVRKWLATAEESAVTAKTSPAVARPAPMPAD